MTPEPSNHEETGEAATADEAAARLEDVQRVTEAALAYLDLDDLLAELLERVTDILKVDTAAVLLMEDDGRTLVARAAMGLEEEVERGFRLPVSRLAVQGQIAETLQRSLLLRTLPQLPGLSMAARYLPAAKESAVGGDWYDVIELGHRQLGLAIGDVAGHGMAAATYMGQLRSAVRAYAMDVETPAELLGKVARFANRLNTRMATVIYATLNLDTWVVDFARAGHPYPLLIGADGTASFLAEAAGPPLGTGAVATYDQQRVTLEAGETLLLYTDGLIERRGRHLSDGEAALVEAAVAAPDEPELKSETIIRRLTEGIDIPDDIAVLAVKSVGLHELLEVEVPAVAEQLAVVRHLLRRWVAANGGSDDDCAAFAIGVTEACANAVEHAYGPGDETIEVRAALVDGVATVTVGDHGGWRGPRGENRGRGIPVMREFMDDVVIDASDDGTTVELRRAIGAGR